MLVFCRVSDSDLSSDPAANLLTSASEEAQKVARNEGKVIQHALTSAFHSLGSHLVNELCVSVVHGVSHSCLEFNFWTKMCVCVFLFFFLVFCV